MSPLTPLLCSIHARWHPSSARDMPANTPTLDMSANTPLRSTCLTPLLRPRCLRCSEDDNEEVPDAELDETLMAYGDDPSNVLK